MGGRRQAHVCSVRKHIAAVKVGRATFIDKEPTTILEKEEASKRGVPAGPNGGLGKGRR